MCVYCPSTGDYRGKGVASEHRSYGAGVGYHDGGEAHTSDFFSHFGGPYYNSYPLQMFDRKLRPGDTVYVGLVATKRPLTADDRRTLALNTPALYERYMFLVKPLADGGAGWTKEDALSASPDPAGADADRVLGGVIPQAISSFYTFHFAFFSSQQAWLDARTYYNERRSGAPMGYAPNARRGNPYNDPVWANINATQAHGFAEPPTKKSKVHYEDAEVGKTFDPYIGVSRREFEGMLGAWKIGKVHDVSAMRKDQYIGGPADTTTGITVSVDIEFKGWRQLRRDFDRPDIGMRIPGAKAWIHDLATLDQASFGLRNQPGQAVPRAEILSIQNQDEALDADAALAFESERFFQWPTRYEPLTDAERTAYTAGNGVVPGLTDAGGKMYSQTPLNPKRFETRNDIFDALGPPSDPNAALPFVNAPRDQAELDADRLASRGAGFSGSDQPVARQRTTTGIQGQNDLPEGLPRDAQPPPPGAPGSEGAALFAEWAQSQAARDAAQARGEAAANEFPLFELATPQDQQIRDAYASVYRAKIDRLGAPFTGGLRERVLTNREVFLRTAGGGARALVEDPTAAPPVAEATDLWAEYAPGLVNGILSYEEFVNRTITVLNGAGAGGAATQAIAAAAFPDVAVAIPVGPIPGGRGAVGGVGNDVELDIQGAGIPGLVDIAMHWQRINLMGYAVWGIEKQEFDDYVMPDIDVRLVRNPQDTRFFSQSDSARLNRRIFDDAIRLARGISARPPVGPSSAMAQAAMPPPPAPSSAATSGVGSVAAAVCATTPASSASAAAPKARGKSPAKTSGKSPAAGASAVPSLGASAGGAAALAAAQRSSPAASPQASPSLAPPAATPTATAAAPKAQQPKRRGGGASAASTADVFSSIFSGASTAGSQAAPAQPAPTSSAAEDPAGPSPSEGSEGGSGSSGSRSRVRRRGDGR